MDRCIECGFCEPLCPSRDLTTTPRQRIAVRREIARLDAAGTEPELRASLEADFPYDVLDTCAADGLCATACPVRIDTGRLTKRFRALRLSPAAHRAAAAVARGFAAAEPALRLALRAGHAFGPLASASTRALRRLGLRVPLWSDPMPRAGARAAVHARGRRRRRLRPLVPHAHDGRAARRARRLLASRGARRRRRPRRGARPRPLGRRGDVLRRAVLLQGLRRGSCDRAEPRGREDVAMVGRGAPPHRHGHLPLHVRAPPRRRGAHGGEPGAAAPA